MFIGAHPDDASVMATFARYLLDEGYKGTVVTLTGGEGGGNATGPELGRPLGLIREEERRALALVEVDSPHWPGLRDFYFTLSAEETERMWGGDAFICDVVRLVRLRRPEVIVTMWPGPGTHGNHQEAGRAATVAFDRAGDPGFGQANPVAIEVANYTTDTASGSLAFELPEGVRAEAETGANIRESSLSGVGLQPGRQAVPALPVAPSDARVG